LLEGRGKSPKKGCSKGSFVKISFVMRSDVPSRGVRKYSNSCLISLGEWSISPGKREISPVPENPFEKFNVR
jgi:hypothetical protein